MTWAKFLFLVIQSLVLAGILRMGQKYGGDGYYWMEGRSGERKLPPVHWFTFLGSLTSLWFGNHRLDVSCPPAGIQLLQRCSSPSTLSPSPALQDTCPEIQLFTGGRRCSLLSTNMSERSAAFLNQKITLSFFLFQLKTMTHQLVQQLDGLNVRLFVSEQPGAGLDSGCREEAVGNGWEVSKEKRLLFTYGWSVSEAGKPSHPFLLWM